MTCTCDGSFRSYSRALCLIKSTLIGSRSTPTQKPHFLAKEMTFPPTPPKQSITWRGSSLARLFCSFSIISSSSAANLRLFDLFCFDILPRLKVLLTLSAMQSAKGSGVTEYQPSRSIFIPRSNRLNRQQRRFQYFRMVFFYSNLRVASSSLKPWVILEAYSQNLSLGIGSAKGLSFSRYS